VNDFRLPKDVRPRRYALRFDLDLDEWSSTGSARIELVTGAPARELVLHALDLEIGSARLDGEPAVGVSYDPESQTARLAFASEIAPGEHALEVEWRGAIRPLLRGLYRSVRGEERYAATQFEAADARRAFPCFDEPEFKARFRIELVHPSGLMAVSNGAVESAGDAGGGRTLTRFFETPPISTYLVAFSAGPYEATPEARTASGVPVRVLVPPGLVQSALFAREAHVRSLEWLERYTDLPYPYGKVDAIGLADFEAGAMENPGAITYRVVYLAADERTASTRTLKAVFSVAAHELTHMWWGDLVTMAWWDDLWLNESFASFVGDKATGELNPQWGYERDVVQSSGGAFGLDSLLSTHAISMEARSVEEATERFDAVTYTKGQLVLRMIEGYIGAEAFREGVRIYLRRHSEANATADDFWRALDEATRSDVTGLAHAWIREPGHPLVRCEASPVDGGLEIRLRQQRMLADPEAPQAEQLWPVPMVFTYGAEGGAVQERYLLRGRDGRLVLPRARWYFPNGGASGFYRYALDDRSVELLAGSIGRLSDVERLDLVGATWALVRARQTSVAQLIELVAGLRGERDRAVLQTLAGVLGWIWDHALTDQTREPFERFVASLFRPELERLGWDPDADDSFDEREKRSTAILALAQYAGAADVRAEARRRIEAHLSGARRIPPDVAGPVAAAAAVDGDRALFDAYVRRMRESEKTDAQEEARFRYALADFTAPAVAESFAEEVFSDLIRVQDRYLILERMLGRAGTRDAAWRAVRARWEADIAGQDPTSKQRILTGVAQLTPRALVPEALAFIESKRLGDTRETAAQALERLRTAAATAERIARDLPAALDRVARSAPAA